MTKKGFYKVVHFLKRLMMRIYLFLSAILFWVLPGRLSLFQGQRFFIGLSELIFLGILFFIFYILPLKKNKSRKVNMCTILLLIFSFLKLGLGVLWSPTGLVASYFSNPSWEGPHEISWAFRNLQENATRIDSKIDFSSYGFSPLHQTFPIYFANDVQRFNWYGNKKAVDKRRYFNFSAIWNGKLRIHPNDPQKGILLANDYAELELNSKKMGASVANVPLFFDLETGIFPITIRYKYASQEPRKLLLGWRTNEGKIEAIPSNRLIPGNTGTQNTTLAILNSLLHILWIGVLGVMVIRIIDVPLKKTISKEKLILFSVALLMIGDFFVIRRSTEYARMPKSCPVGMTIFIMKHLRKIFLPVTC